MVSKKTKNADLESRKKSYLQLGFLVAISFTLVAFEWSTATINVEDIEITLNDELNSEVVNEITVSKPSIPKPAIKSVVVKNPSEVIISKELPKIKIKKKAVFFDEVDPFQFEGADEDSIIVEDVKFVPETQTYNAGSSFFDGILPHYIECEGLSKKDMFDCISDEINEKLSPNAYNIRSLHYTGEKLVRATFTVDEKGNVSEIYIHSEKKFEKDLIKEVKRAIFNLPPMIPGSQGGYPIRARFTVPISFKVQ